MAGSTFIKDRVDALDKWLWQPDLSSNALWENFLIKVLRINYAVIRDLRDGQLSLRAMSLVYTTVIAIVPLLAISFLVLKGFGLHNKVEPALLDALEDIGDKRYDIVENVMGFIDNVKVEVLGAVGFALLIYSVISMMHKIERSFNYTWQIKRDRNMSERFRDYLSVIFVGPTLIFLSAAITTSVNTNSVVSYIEAMPLGSDFVGFVSAFIPYLIMSLGFAFIYTFLPNTRVKLIAAFIGGLVTAVIWKIMGWGVSTFVANSASNIAIYSAFASVIILMMWMYIGWLVLLVGASVSFYVQNPQYILVRKDNISLTGESNEKLALGMLYLIAESYQKNRTAWNVDTLGRQLRIAPHVVDDMAEFLVTVGYIVRTGDQGAELYPKQPIEQVELSKVLRQVRELAPDGEYIRTVRADAVVDHLFDDLRLAIDQQFGNKTLKELLNYNAENHDPN